MSLYQPWSSTGDKVKDDHLMKLFSTGDFYDCTFKVTSDATGEIKRFRCHKLFLASCSEPFAKMLFGSFKESHVDRDFEICISNTSPEIFELAMRYVYGRCIEEIEASISSFDRPRKMELAVGLYLFAHQWMLPQLMDSMADYLETFIMDEEDALAVLQHLIDFEESDIRKMCLAIIEANTEHVLHCNLWVQLSKEVVLEILRLNSLQVVDEARLFHYLVKWGRTGTKDDDEARSKIDDGLKLIRFCAMSVTSFSNLCSNPLPLTSEEKFKILLSITQHNSNLMPQGFSTVKVPRSYHKSKFDTSCTCRSTSKAIYCSVDDQTPPFHLKLLIDTPAHYLSGLKLTSLTQINAGQRVQLTCEVFRSPE